MTKQEKEKARLHDIVFEGMDMRYRYAVKNGIGDSWECLTIKPNKPNPNYGAWPETITTHSQPCKNQPETFLDWTETLIRRGDI